MYLYLARKGDPIIALALTELQKLGAMATYEDELQPNLSLSGMTVIALYAGKKGATYPSRFLRVVTDQVRQKGFEVPVWAAEWHRQIAFRPDQAPSTRAQRRNFEEAVQQLHRTMTGWRPPQKKRARRRSGWHARHNRAREARAS